VNEERPEKQAIVRYKRESKNRGEKVQDREGKEIIVTERPS
jgi:hypothetical protein